MFSGIGGFEKGIEQALGDKTECVGYSEIDKYAIKIYERHFPGRKNFGDATRIIPGDLPDFDLLTAGFPCQSFSRGGGRRGYEDSRGTLFFDICRIAEGKHPKFLLLENVAALLDHDGGKSFETILASLFRLGYDAVWRVLDGWDFGSSTRKRVYILAILRDNQSDAGKRLVEALPLDLSVGPGDRDEADFWEQEDSGDAERIVRAFARLPDWLDSWDSLYSA